MRRDELEPSDGPRVTLKFACDECKHRSEQPRANYLCRRISPNRYITYPMGDYGTPPEWCPLRQEAMTSFMRPEHASPDDLRVLGWSVAAHNDYRINGGTHTFWLFTKGDRCVKGEGRTDREALDLVRAQVRDATETKSGTSE